jgi:hypothetical protein
VDGGLTELRRLVTALRAIEDELPSLTGDAWPEFSRDLTALLAQANRRDAAHALVAARLRSLLARYPAVNARVHEALRDAGVRPPRPASKPRRIPSPTMPRRLERRPPAPAPSPAPREAPERRVVNLAVLRSDFRRIPADRPLEPAKDHFLRLDIGPPGRDSVVRAPTAFPVQHLPPSTTGHWLEVGVASAEFSVAAEIFHLFLPRRGPSWVCPCEPGGPHTCRPGQREPFLLIPVRTPGSGSASLRVAVWFLTSVVQSLVLVADVGTEGAHAAHVDYTLTEDLTDLDEVEPRAVSVVTNARHDGTHALVFNAGSGEVGFTLAEGQLITAMDELRGLLLDVHIERIGNSRKSRLDKRNGKPPKAFAADLERLARAGWRLWAALFAQQREAMVAALGTAATIQVARVPSSMFVYPWSCVYDLPLDAVPELCPMVAEWEGGAPLLDGYPTECPYHERHRPKDTLCPFGFWGVRHRIEQPSSTGGRRMPRTVQAPADPEVVLVRSTALDERLARDHAAGVQAALPGFRLTEVTSRDGACAELAAHDLALVEFYCHGRGEPERHWLEVGRDEQIHPEQIATWTVTDWLPMDRHWSTSAPLVVLNGCHTAELTPQSPVSFVDQFAAANAGGVVGTEVTLEQPMAGEAAERLLRHFAGGDVGVGEALRRMRLDLLAKGNLLGLAYTAYCSADLKLVRVG